MNSVIIIIYSYYYCCLKWRMKKFSTLSSFSYWIVKKLNLKMSHVSYHITILSNTFQFHSNFMITCTYTQLHNRILHKFVLNQKLHTIYKSLCLIIILWWFFNLFCFFFIWNFFLLLIFLISLFLLFLEMKSIST